MSLPSEQNKPKSLSISQLVQHNAQALETRERIPYQHTVYAIPEEWRKKEEQMLADAVLFQPTLYKMIEVLATRENINEMEQNQLQMIQQRCAGMESKVERTLERDGKKREESFSDLSKTLSASLRELGSSKDELERICRKWVLISAAISAVSSMLACILCLLLAG